MAHVDGNNDLADPDLDGAARIDTDADDGAANDTDHAEGIFMLVIWTGKPAWMEVVVPVVHT
jgi:hypothetical protein